MSTAPDPAVWQSALATRFASSEMLRNFSDLTKFRTWRRLWIALAEAEKELGLPITAAQIAEMKQFQEDLNLEAAREREREVRHDVMAHVHAFGLQCPKAKPIIHLGATSAYVGDNTDLILMREGMLILRRKLVNVIDRLGAFAEVHRGVTTLGFTHFQPAQLTTVGKRACIWAQEFAMDLTELESRLERLRFRGGKGTTGTQASFVELFDGDHEKVKRLDQMITEAMGFKESFPVTGQTYPRKLDAQVLAMLSGIAQSCQKSATDLRLLHHLREVEEPFESGQIGSSAMAYKRNPMRCERMTALSRFVICMSQNAAVTAAEQWLERTLDDSANRRLSLPGAFLATDAVLHICLNVVAGLRVNANVIARHVAEELPFMATEAILMAAVKAGGDRQEIHERIRRHALAAGRRLKAEGGHNDLMDRVAADPAFSAVHHKLAGLLQPAAFVGRAPEQVDAFISTVIAPVREQYADELGMSADLDV